MIVIHGQQQECDAEDSAERCGGERPLVDRYAEELEDNDADRNVDKDEQDFHD